MIVRFHIHLIYFKCLFERQTSSLEVSLDSLGPMQMLNPQNRQTFSTPVVTFQVQELKNVPIDFFSLRVYNLHLVLKDMRAYRQLLAFNNIQTVTLLNISDGLECRFLIVEDTCFASIWDSKPLQVLISEDHLRHH